MPRYDFTTLNDKDFEELARDLLNKKFSFNLQSYKSGRDAGIDLRDSSSANPNKTVVQVKHYYNSGYKVLLRTLKKEVAKVSKLKPGRYFVVTSVPLSAANQDEIKALFKPFIKSAGDVIGNETLNAWLGEYKEVEQVHFKLWLSSTEIINNIINNAVTGRSSYYIDWIKDRIRYYVPTQAYHKAYDQLLKNKILIITGQPGAGKTTLADMLSFRMLAEGYHLFKIESIKEAEENLSRSPDQKQLFYFDDFLGAIHLDLAMNKHLTDASLDQFFRTIRKSSNKLFVLTSRTVILNQGLETYERFRYAFLDREKTELSINEYSDLERGKILYNHIYFHGLPSDHVAVIKQDGFFLEIIRHGNFNPRVIEFVTNPARLETILIDDYKQFVLNTLANPADIWRFSFEKQLNDEERFLLLGLFSLRFGLPVDESLVQEIYEKRLQYEIANHNHRLSFDSFQKAMKVLVNGFISRQISIEGRNPIAKVAFINPSLQDFLRFFLASSVHERVRMIGSFSYIEQVERFVYMFMNTGFTTKEIDILEKLLLADTLFTYEFKYTVTDKQIRCFCLISIISPGNKAALQALEKIDFNNFDSAEKHSLVETLDNSINNPDLKKIIQLNFDQLIMVALREISGHIDIPSFCQLFNKYERDLAAFFSNEEHIEVLRSRFHMYIEFKISLIKSDFFYREDITGAYTAITEFIRDQTTIIENELQGYFKLDYAIPDEYEWMRENEDEFVSIVERYDGYVESDEEIAEQEEEEEIRAIFE
jgi:energy-coupling factor transporter ATP-binding protein EcfA2